MAQTGLKIGVFDSGIGGLTVLKALKSAYPAESYVYIGDTARLPYGTKSRETVIRYSESLTRCVLKQNVNAVIVACNTASTHALESVKAMAAPIPVLGMIEPAAAAAVKTTKKGHIGVIATSGTILSNAYPREIGLINKDIRTESAACQMLVALAEEGWNGEDDPVTLGIIRRYLEPMFDKNDAPDTLILGCTHFPVFEKAITAIIGEDVTLINSGQAAAHELAELLPDIHPDNRKAGAMVNDKKTTFFATDDPVRFARNAARFYDHALSPDQVSLIDI